MKRMTPKEQAQNNRRLNPSDLEKITDVYGDTAYIPKERKPDRLIPMYQENGLRVVELRKKDNIKWWSGVYLHPDNILTPNTPPMSGDYLQLLHDGKPSENHTEIFTTLGTLGQGLFLIEDMHGEPFACVRNEPFDTSKNRGWQEIITATA